MYSPTEQELRELWFDNHSYKSEYIKGLEDNWRPYIKYYMTNNDWEIEYFDDWNWTSSIYPKTRQDIESLILLFKKPE